MESSLINTQATEVVKRIQSVEQVIWERMQLISVAYQTLCNVTTGKEALECLGQIMLVSRDLIEQIKKILTACNCPPSLIKDPTRFAGRDLDNLWNNAYHFYNRFLHAENPEGKTKELTRLYHFLVDVERVALETKADRYSTGIKRVKEAIQGDW